MEGIIVLSKKEEARVRVMEQVILGRISIKQASEFMGLSYRQARRITKRYAIGGVTGIRHKNTHKNRGMVPGNVIGTAVLCERTITGVLTSNSRGSSIRPTLGRVLDELGAASIPAYSPQAKGRIERLLGTLQDRLIPEMRLAGIGEIEAANRWIDDRYSKRGEREELCQTTGHGKARSGWKMERVAWR